MKSIWGKDILASVVVFLVALPLCLGVAVASGVPPEYGLISGIIGGLVIGSIAGSPLQVSGPAAGLIVLVVELIREHGVVAFGWILLLAGVLQFASGFLRLGQWFRAISPAVVYGMLAGIGLLIVLGQFHVMLDDAPKGSGLNNLASIPDAIFKGIFPIDGSVHETAAVTGLLTIVVMLLWTKFRPARFQFLPPALLGVIAAGMASAFFGLEIRHVNIPDSLLATLRLPNLGDASILLNWKIWVEAASVAFIASAETLLSAAAVDRMVSLRSGPKIKSDYDRELIAQGVGNMMCGFLGALPVTGVIVRSSANVQAGGQTRAAAILHGFWLLAIVVAFPHWLEWIPTAALAAVLVLTGLKLISAEPVVKLRQYGRMPVVIYFATVLGIVAFDLLTGVIAGIALTAAEVVYRFTRLRVKFVPHHSGRIDIYLEGSATVMRLPSLTAALDRVPAGSEVHIHFEKMHYIDHSCYDLLKEWGKSHEETGGRLFIEWNRLHDRFEVALP